LFQDAEWSGSGKSLQRLLESDTNIENPTLKQRFKENAVTMNKMSELRSQLENLSMGKKSKKKRPKSHIRNQSRQSQSKWSAASSTTANHSNPNKLVRTKRQNSIPLPPIQASHSDVMNDEDEDFCTIQPLSDLQGRQSGLLKKNPKQKSSINSTVPDWLNQNDSSQYHHGRTFPLKHKRERRLTGTDHEHPWSKSRLSRLSSDEEEEYNNNSNNNNNNNKVAESKKKLRRSTSKQQQQQQQQQQTSKQYQETSKQQQQQQQPRDFDLVDLQFRPENASLEIVKHRKTQRLISADLSTIQDQDSSTRMNTGEKARSLLMSSNESSKAEMRKKWIKSKKSDDQDFLTRPLSGK
jgi:hypothetical protein